MKSGMLVINVFYRQNCEREIFILYQIYILKRHFAFNIIIILDYIIRYSILKNTSLCHY